MIVIGAITSLGNQFTLSTSRSELSFSGLYTLIRADQIPFEATDD